MTKIIIGTRVLHEILTFLIYSIVGQVHAEVVEIATKRRYIILRREPRQALLVNEDAKRDDTRDQHVDAQVELEIIDEEGLVEVALRHIVLSMLDPLEVPRQEDSFSLATGLWFNYKCLRFAIVKLLLELLYVLGQ